MNFNPGDEQAPPSRRIFLQRMSLLAASLPLARLRLGAAGAPLADAASADVHALLEATEFVRGLDEMALIKLVPGQSGLTFVGCPNCRSGRQENQLTWMPAHPDEVSCRYCGERYPSAKYPMNASVTVRTPRGGTARYPYWADPTGYRYFFRARRENLVRGYLANCAQDLARLYAATKDKAHARRAALLLDRFAQVFPDWCYHYDFMFRQKEIYDGDVPPEKFRPGYRTSRWDWWAYLDVPVPLVRAYGAVRGSGIFAELSRERGVDVEARIERDLFRNAGDQVLGNPEQYSNMSPIAWQSLILMGRVIAEPRYVHEPVRRFRRFLDTQFLYDGAWHESPSYADQTVSNMEKTLAGLRGYSDPSGYADPDGARFDNLDLARDFPALRQSRAALMKMRLPDARLLPFGDTWASARIGEVPPSMEPCLLPARGLACLGGGSGGGQIQFDLTWGGGYGHSHADSLGLLLFAHGRETLSDLGYTHTAFRAWVLATAAHNTVVIDGLDQPGSNMGDRHSDGNLRRFDAKDARIQVVSADGDRAYPGLAKTYRRTLVVVDADRGRRYAVDSFEVEGGRTHDYFLHGDADAPAIVAADLKLAPLATLLPARYDWKAPRNEGELERASEPHYAYGFLRRLEAASVPAGSAISLAFRLTGSSGPGLRATLFAEAGSRLITGENPSIRLAGEDDANLEKFARPFAVLRHEAPAGRSSFVSVLEPHAEAPFLTSVERVLAPGGAFALRVRLGERTDIIVIGAASPVGIPAGMELATFQGEVGVLSLRGEAVEHAYALGAGGWTRGKFRLASGGPHSGLLRAVERHTLVLENSPAPLPETGDIVRLLTADGWVYPYTVVAAEGGSDALRIRVAESPGCAFDAAAQRLRLTAFPQREHAGAVRVEWNPSTRTPIA